MKTLHLKKQNLFRSVSLIVLSLLLSEPAFVQGQNWKTTGNSVGSTNFLGTTNIQDLRIRTNNLQRMVITTGGNVGIGTTSPIAPLHIALNSSSYALRIDQGVTGHGILSYVNTTSDGQILLNATSNVNGLIVLGNGKVGIGTTSPDRSLTIYNSAGSYMNTKDGTRELLMGVDAAGGIISVMSNHDLILRTGTNVEKMRVTSTGNVGIGTTTPGYPLEVTSGISATATGMFVNTSAIGFTALTGICKITEGSGIGIKGEGGSVGVDGVVSGGDESFDRIGVLGFARSGEHGQNYGVWGEATSNNNGTAYNIGVYGIASGGASDYAGYFNGNVGVVGEIVYFSDRRLKQDINPLTDAITIINRLKPSVYTFRTEEYKQMHLPKGIRYGLIADELEQVLPNDVKKIIQPAEYENHDSHNGKKLSDEAKFSAVNYIELIPILIGAVKEQQAVIEKLSAKVAALQGNSNTGMNNTETGNMQHQNQSVVLTGMNNAYLGQNIPNPFSEETRIEYYIPEALYCGNQTCRIIFYDQLGRTMQEAEIVESGFGTINVSTKNLSDGVFTYKLLVNGEVIDIKKMVFNK